MPSLAGYSDPQIEQGLCFIAMHQVAHLLWVEEIALDRRISCIEAMPSLFERFFKDKPLDTICYMWWDLIGPAQHPQFADTLLKALERVLKIEAEHCQVSAIHGLGHLEHPGKERVLRAYLARTSQLTDEAKAYVEQAIRGEVL